MVENRFNELVEIINRLRKECPWDREQTHDSIKAQTLEEVYEVIEAIDNKDFTELKTELGDLLLHVIFHTIIAEEDGKFYLHEVIDTIKNKLIRRHPHVFGNTEVKDSKQVIKNWEEIKLKEGRKSVLDGVPKNLPELQRACCLQDKASKVGFDWDKKDDVWKKVLEEIDEMHEAEILDNKEKLEEETGDLFFALINYCRFIGVNPENALRKTNTKFIKRFKFVEEKISASGKSISESSLEEMDKFWEESKKNG